MVAWFGGGWGGGPWIGVLWLLFWAALVIGAVYLFRRRPPQRDPGESAATALAERYARGEIDEDEYRKRLLVLREG
jgi:putative membrane protein